MNVTVLVVTGCGRRRDQMGQALHDLPHVRTFLDHPDRLWDRLNGGDIDLVLLDRSSLSPQPEIVVTALRKVPEQPEVIALTDREDAEARAVLLAAGCMAVLFTGLEPPALRKTLEALIDRRRRDLKRQVGAEQRPKRSRLQDFVSSSPVMQRFMVLAQRVVNSDSSLLLLGETGVGKERLASAIHNEGKRSAGPFICINCPALPETLLESELFGHEKGAFTGATRTRRGYFELAHGGTIFLDEIAELSPHLQAKLLRVLEERTVQRLGGETPLHIDVRLMAATNRELETEVAAGRFRADLFYRLAVVTLLLPPLRERREDISGLLDSYLDHFMFLSDGSPRTMTPRAREALIRYSWPGNVRELINIIERTTLVTPTAEIDLEDLPPGVRGPDAMRNGASSAADPRIVPDSVTDWKDIPLATARDQALSVFHQRYLGALLAANTGRIGETARAAGISERTLYSLMKRYGLRKEAYKDVPAGDAETSASALPNDLVPGASPPAKKSHGG